MTLTVRHTKDGVTKIISNAKIMGMQSDNVPDYIKDEKGKMHMVLPMDGIWEAEKKHKET